MKKTIRILAIVLVLASVLTIPALAASSYSFYRKTMYKDTNYVVFTGKTVTKSGVSVSDVLAFYNDMSDDDYVISFYLYSTNGNNLWGSKNIASGGTGTVGSSGAGSAKFYAYNSSPDDLTVSFNYSY